MNKFDIVECHGIDIGVIVSDPFECHCPIDGCATSVEHASSCLEIDNPECFKQSIECVVVYSFLGDKVGHVVCTVHNLKPCSMTWMEGYVPYDTGTSELTRAMALIRYAGKLWAGTPKD